MLLETRSSAALILLVLLLACQTSAAPSAEDVALRLPEFYFPALPITGLYLNQDTDAIIFRYSVTQDERPVWLQRISDTARARGWKVVYEGQSGDVRSLHLQRIDDPRHRFEDWHSLEIVRITSCGSVLLIGGIQADMEEESGLAEASAEGPRWYQKRFWPLVAKYRTEACGTPAAPGVRSGTARSSAAPVS
jgi:hypothetical protein